MATIAPTFETQRGEERFFFVMACVMSALIIAGFSANIMLGRSSFSLPWVYHFHAWVMLAWIALYLAQNSLIFAGNVVMHRRLGWLAVPLVPLVALMAVTITRTSLKATGGPFFFPQNEFLIANTFALAAFLGLVTWAVLIRSATGWHRRLMFTAFALLLGPGLGRLLPMPLFMPNAWIIGSVIVPMLFPVIGMIADRRRYGKVHPAWYWAVGLVLLSQAAAEVLAYSEWGIEFTRSFVAGTPGANRPMEAFIPQGM